MLRNTFSGFAAFCAAVALAASVVSVAHADTIIYLSNGAAPPGNLDVSLTDASIGGTGSFDIFVRSDLLVAGVALNLTAEGPSIRFTSGEVPNYNGPRWANVQNGTVSGDGLSITGMDAFAIPGFGSNGLNPAAPGTDNGYNAGANAFHFATINYNVIAAGLTTFKLSVGDNEVGVDGPIFLGVGDAMVCETGAGCAGATSAAIDGMINVLQNGGGGNPPVVQDFVHPRMSAYVGTDPADILHTFTQVGGDDPITWSNFMLDSYTPNYGGVGTGPAIGATFDPATQQFVWNAVGSPRGDYVWKVTASNAAGEDTGFLTVQLKAVPEPTTLGLAGLAMIGLVGLFRRRS